MEPRLNTNIAEFISSSKTSYATLTQYVTLMLKWNVTYIAPAGAIYFIIPCISSLGGNVILWTTDTRYLGIYIVAQEFLNVHCIMLNVVSTVQPTQSLVKRPHIF